MLRNQFNGVGVFQISAIPKASLTDEDFENTLLIGFDCARADDEKNRHHMVQLFLYVLFQSTHPVWGGTAKVHKISRVP